jgi:hypothetical protein
VQDEGGQTFNVKAFGAKGDGVTDDLEAIKGAIAAAAHVGGGTILFPQGTYRTSGEVSILSSWIHLSGVGVGVSVLQCDSGVMKAIKFGDKGTTPRTHHGVNYCSVSKLNVVRAPGPIPVNSVGIAWECFTKSGEQDVIVRNHYYNRSFEGGEGGISIGWRGVNCYAGNATGAYVWLNGAAGVTFSGAYFGYGSEVVYPVYCIEISGTANDINFTDATVIPDGPTKHDIFGFTHYTGVGVISLINFNTEHARYGFVSDAASPVITELKIVGGRWICGTDVFHLNPATHLANFSLTSGASIGGPFNLPPSGVWTRVQGCFFGSAVTLNGGLIPNSRGKLADLAFTGNTCAGNLSAIGDWDALAVDGNVVRGNITNAASGSVSFGSNAKVQRRDAR